MDNHPTYYLDPKRRHSRRGDPSISQHMHVRRRLFDLARQESADFSDDWLARLLNTSRTRTRHLSRGHIEHFNSETLIDILARLGVFVEVVVTQRLQYAIMNVPIHRRSRARLPNWVW